MTNAKSVDDHRECHDKVRVDVSRRGSHHRQLGANGIAARARITDSGRAVDSIYTTHREAQKWQNINHSAEMSTAPQRAASSPNNKLERHSIERISPARSLMSPNCYQWCGLRPSILGQDRSETKKTGFGLGLGLAVLVLFCETRSCNARRHNDLGGHNNFLSTICSFSILAWNITTVEINSGVYLLKS